MNKMTCLLSTAYWPPIQYFAIFNQYTNIAVEQWETYPKQTYRNRCQIYGPNGSQSLIVPVEKGSFHKTLIKDLKIAYDTKWQKNHLKSIDAAYRSSPFFEYYIDDLLMIYEKNYTYLLDLNFDILNTSLKWLRFKNSISKTNSYERTGNFIDFRNSLHPKLCHIPTHEKLTHKTYIQGFEQRHGFISNLSVLDLVFNTGAEATSFLNC